MNTFFSNELDKICSQLINIRAAFIGGLVILLEAKKSDSDIILKGVTFLYVYLKFKNEKKTVIG